ncbi:right-handed parallel beta-helix repeat-containing protein [Polyangium jinanense]|uniref:Right-handed parallel beta-helix repeat-containing protein n=1 Tax=Polyangium jinanense TaxID=2829994 RepID=A0A9X3X4P7_9BACT|nr:right-handed parallel beta-helix repeat-containing protein [Polyangium jinanense]MDC3954843.1 right-handed parallel beta-helix repeat-containing protein [Polyangium jinanense]MDC3981386.1 right-handed parallel beta-helix repeat-containing protein [Polyangium jinanense]
MLSKISRSTSFAVAPVLLGLLGALALTQGCGTDPGPGASGSSSSGTNVGGVGGAGGSGGTGGVGGAGGTGGMDAGPPWDPTVGWTHFEESADTQKIYVSSSDGDDNNDGLSPEKAVKTIAKGKQLLRDGFPDWLLLKRGDAWNEGLGTWTLSGRGTTEPMLVSTYGDAVARPLLETGAKRGLYADPGVTLQHLAFVGIHFHANTRDPASPDFVGPAGDEGVMWLAKGGDLLFEDLMIQSYTGNISIQGIQGKINNVRVRRSVIVDAYDIEDPDPNETLDDSEGLYAMNVDVLVLEGNVFDHNGWNADVPGANATLYNHNVYIQSSCSKVTIRGNITTRAASHGIQARAGGVVDKNLVIDNPIGFSYGLTNGSATPVPGGVTGTVTGNVVGDAGDITAAEARGIGIQIGNIKSAVVENNILAHDKTAGGNHIAFELTRKYDPMQVPDEAISDLTIRNNVVYDWRGGIRFSTTALTNVKVEANDVQSPLRGEELVRFFNQDFNAGVTFGQNRWFSSVPDKSWFEFGPEATGISFTEWVSKSKETESTNTAVSYPDPERKLGTYHASLGKEATFEAYIAEARKQSRYNYRYEYTAEGPITYIRAGFGKD